MKKYMSIMYKMTKNNRGMYALCLALQFFYVIVSLLTQFINKIVIDVMTNTPPSMFLDRFLLKILGGHDFVKANIWILAVSIIVFGLITAFAQIARRVMFGKIESRIAETDQNELFYHIERFSYNTIKKMKSGDLIQTCTRDEETLRRFVINDVNQIFYTFFLVIDVFILLVFINWIIALVSIVILPMMSIYSYFGIKEVRKRYRLIDDVEGLMTAKIEENISSTRVVKAYNNELHEIKEFEKHLKQYENKFIHWRKRCALFFTTTDIIIFSQIGITTISGILLCAYNYISLGTMIIANQFCFMMIFPVRNVGMIMSNLARAVVSLDRINLILEQPLEDIDSGTTPLITGAIEFKNVAFHFDDDDKNKLENLSFTIKKGQTVAIMGKTGSGKSTLTNLLTRLFDPTGGEVYIDGNNLLDIQKKHLRNNIAVVLQEPFLFSKSVYQNITISASFAKREDVETATSIASLESTISSLEKGYDTEVGEKGVTLSGGQKQRISIARTVIKKAPILIFDDSLSAVDTETDMKIRKSIRERSKDMTTLIVTHRIATAKDSDLIIVLDEGKLLEIGTHEQLIKNNKLYQQIFEIQTRLE